jgi:uncharacterized protein with WD repeat
MSVLNISIAHSPGRRKYRSLKYYMKNKIQVDRQKSKNTKTYSFELFRLKERDVPIEVLEITSHVVTFAWEPKGHRFCLVHGEPPRVDCSFYTMQKEGKPQVQLLLGAKLKPKLN